MFDHLDLAGEENCILPFHMDMDGILLKKATAQPITRLERGGDITYVFLKPEGMKAAFYFEEGVQICGGNPGADGVLRCEEDQAAELFRIAKGDRVLNILCLKRDMANQMYLLKDQTLLFAHGAIMETEDGIRLESRMAANRMYSYPKDGFCGNENVVRADETDPVFDIWKADTQERELSAKVVQTAATRFTVKLPENFMDGLKDLLVQIRYQGDIGHLFINGTMVNDNFCNGDVWEFGVRTFEEELKEHPLTLTITPLRVGANVNVESAMAARMENAEAYIGELERVELCPVYEFVLR